MLLDCLWCREGDSNSHTLRRRILNPLRLPIPPSRQASNGANYARNGRVRQPLPSSVARMRPDWRQYPLAYASTTSRVSVGLLTQRLPIIRTLEAT